MSKSNLGLVTHCKTAVKEKWGYVYGTYGEILTASILNQKIKQYQFQVKKYEDFIRQNWLGKRTVDCVGLIKSYIWWNENAPSYQIATDKSANNMYNIAKEKGIISTLPELPGICVWRTSHIGVYIGDGQVIESKGTKYGVVQTPLTGKGANTWTHWLKCPYIEYIEKESSNTFSDVKNDRWSYESIEKAAKLGLVQGNPDGTFNLTRYLTREQAAVIAVRIYEKIMEVIK